MKLLRVFVMVASELSFTRAARRLGASQATVSARIRQLEELTETPLLERDTHSVSLTRDGETFLHYARQIIALSEEAVHAVGERPRRQKVRFGVSEDFAFRHLPAFLADLRRRSPEIEVELSIALSIELHRRLRRGDLDVILAKRPLSGSASGSTVSQPLFADRLVWLSVPTFEVPLEGEVPLVLYPPPSITRDAALDAFADCGRGHFTAATATSLTGLRAATLGGLGVMPFASSLIPDGLVQAPPERLPPLPETIFVAATRKDPPTAALSLVETLTTHLDDALPADITVL